MIELAVGIRQLFSSFDPCADSDDSYLYNVHIEFIIQISSLSFPIALSVGGANWGALPKISCRPLEQA